ncbi:capsular biosynthesis protein [Staphylococcus petrasii]|uniref:capsular biosynthesis protein n=1 Tax=Staphylococcus petrasii TaxID=1276936 RepID=UPI000CD07553|nr:capsular biosynthesis protein [Staphylococcus petrasii]PNZ80414.1 capsular biosynthesis protein [Staphylococcus petrasii]TGA81523.1 capsular biosynthesis protein [Staphylococcus petrasii]SUM59005.1 capsular polysaccharide synthesis protein Cap5K [Staphylococcus petrasii]
MSRKLFIIDTLKTIVSSLLIALGLQFIAYPFIHRGVGDKAFGEILTIYTILTIASVVLGNTLNNIRLINVDHYSPNYHFSKFSKTLFTSILIETVVLLVILIVFFNLNILDIFILLIINLLMCLRIYLNVFFRMKLEYNKILYVAIVQFVGMMIGLLVFLIVHYWIIVFLMSELFAVAYTIFALRHLKSGDNSPESKPILKDFIMLLGTNGLNNVNLYLDRLILLPFIGGKAVTLAFLATFVGKMLATFMYPVNNVLLSYISVNSNWNKFKQYISVNLYSIVALIIVMIISYPLTIFIVSWLYQTDPQDFKHLIIIGNLGVLINAISIMIQTLNTKHISITKQANYITIHTIIYIIVAIFVTISFGLSGFFWATLIANLIKFLVLNLLGINGIKKQKDSVGV